MDIVRYTEEYNKVWDEFVEQSKNGTIFHSRRFLSYHPTDKFNDSSLIFKKKDAVVAVLPAAFVIEKDLKILKSHPGASYGGPVLSDKVTLKLMIEIVDGLLEYAHDIEIDRIEMRIAPRVYQRYPSEELDYVLTYKGFDVTATELSSAVSLDNGKITSRFRSDTLRSAKKAKKQGIEVRESKDWMEYWPLLYKNLMERHKAAPTHTMAEIQLLSELFPDKVRLFAAYYEDKLVAGTMVFVCNSKACHTFYIAQDYDYQRIRPINLLFHDLLSQLQQEGFKYLNFGISTEAGGTIINPGLFRFKEGFGGCGVVRRYYSRRVDKDEG